jgi:hypothetical protein
MSEAEIFGRKRALSIYIVGFPATGSAKPVQEER